MVISTLNMEQLYLREDRQRRRRNDDKQDNEKEADDAEAKDGEAENQVSWLWNYVNFSRGLCVNVWMWRRPEEYVRIVAGGVLKFLRTPMGKRREFMYLENPLETLGEKRRITPFAQSGAENSVRLLVTKNPTCFDSCPLPSFIL